MAHLPLAHAAHPVHFHQSLLTPCAYTHSSRRAQRLHRASEFLFSPVRWNVQLLKRAITPLAEGNRPRSLLNLAARVTALALWVLTLPLALVSALISFPLRFIDHRLAISHSSNVNSSRTSSAQSRHQDVVNAFAEYCADHPRSFLALVCNPALDRFKLLSHPPQATLTNDLNEILLRCLGRSLADASRFRDAKAFINELENLYHSQLHGSYDLFFRNLLLGEQRYIALGEAKPNESTVLTLEDIARIIRKCHDPRYAHLGILNRQTYTFIASTNLQSLHTMPVNLLTHCLYVLTVTGVTGTLNVNQPSLYEVDAQGTHLMGVDLSHCKRLTKLYLSNNQLTEIDLSHNRSLYDLYLRNNQLTEIGLSCNQALRVLDLENNQLTKIDLSCNPNLSRLNASGNQLTTIDLSHNPNLLEIDLRGNPNLRRLDLRNNRRVETVLVDPGVEVLRA